MSRSSRQAFADSKSAADDTANPAAIAGPATAEGEMTGGAGGLPEENDQSTGTVVREPAVPPEPVKRWRVTAGGHVMLDGMRVPMRVGKEVSELSYDVNQLKLQGIKLEPITGGE